MCFTCRFAHVTLANSADADKALALSGMELGGNPIKVDMSRRRDAAPRASFGGNIIHII